MNNLYRVYKGNGLFSESSSSLENAEHAFISAKLNGHAYAYIQVMNLVNQNPGWEKYERSANFNGSIYVVVCVSN